MKVDDIRKKYINYFVSKGHKQIDAAPLVLEDDPTTLFTSAGMQPLVPYLRGDKVHAEGKRLVNSQPSFRAEDIEEVGDNRHTTFFEMLGNWSLGDYFKEEQLSWIWEFLTEELKLPKDSLHVTIFEGTKDVPKDNESAQIWEKLGVKDDHIHYYGAEKNWWSRSGTPERMIVGDIGGPDSEVFFDFGEDKKIHENSPYKNQKCHPNCDCGRFVEIGNSVFIQYKKEQDGSLSELSQKNVDFGGGLERIAAAKANDPDIFNIDIFSGAKKVLEDVDTVVSEDSQKAIRIILDHIRASLFLIDSGVFPSNKAQGYVLRRLIRRSAVFAKVANMDLDSNLANLIQEYKQIYPSLSKISSSIISDELNKFEKTLGLGMRKILQSKESISGKDAFDFYQTYGFPLELTLEILEKEGLRFSDKDKKEFEEEFEKHKELSRTASAGMFKGGLAEQTEETTKLHTATHLLNQALREVLGGHVLQKGANITESRLRFDFSHPQKLTPDEMERVEKLINKKIEENLPVTFSETSVFQAKEDGAIGVFDQRYGEKVKVYKIGDFSKEICGGPHVGNTGEIGRVKITKEESASAGVRRIYASINK